MHKFNVFLCFFLLHTFYIKTLLDHFKRTGIVPLQGDSIEKLARGHPEDSSLG